MRLAYSTLIFKCLPIGFIMLLGYGQARTQSNPSEFKPSGKIWGYAFGDAYIKASGDTATWASRAEYSGIPKSVYAFSIRRLYLGYDYAISPTFSTSALLEGGDGFQTRGGDRTVTIKSLHVRWKDIYKGADLLLGQMSTLTFSLVVEKVWNYRSVEKTMADMRGIRSSSDMGIALHGRFDTLGQFGYNLMIGNGSGVRSETLTDAGKHKIFYSEVFAFLLDRKVVLDLYADYETGPDRHNTYTIKGFAAYQTKPLTIGAEVLTQNHRHAKSDNTDSTPFGVSVFARGRIKGDKLGFFARYDVYNPDSHYRDQDVLPLYNASQMRQHYSEQFLTAGLDYAPHKNVHFMPNIWIDRYKAKTESDVLVTHKADIVPRLTFFFIFR